MFCRLFILFCCYVFIGVDFAKAADNIRIVGSSSISPFISLIAEEFGKFSVFKTPVVESIGSGAGFKIFCSGTGTNKPDITTASRRIKDAEVQLCNKNGVNNIIEIVLGYDGIVIANSKNSAKFDFNKYELFDALFMYDAHSANLAKNKSKSWSDINPKFPSYDIEVYGPNKNTGTYSEIVEMLLVDSCMRDQNMAVNYTDFSDRKSVCSKIRDDGLYIEGTTNENVIIQKIEGNKNAFGIFSFSFLLKNSNLIQGSSIAGIDPTYQSISSHQYPLSRPLYIYIKGEHLNVTPGLKEFLKEMVNPDAIGVNGYLIPLGLIALSEQEMKQTTDRIAKILS